MQLIHRRQKCDHAIKRNLRLLDAASFVKTSCHAAKLPLSRAYDLVVFDVTAACTAGTHSPTPRSAGARASAAAGSTARAAADARTRDRTRAAASCTSASACRPSVRTHRTARAESATATARKSRPGFQAARLFGAHRSVQLADRGTA